MSIVYPSLEEARLLLNDYLSDSNILRHCEATRQKALRIAKILSAKIRVDFDLVSIGGLLHDLGRARTHDATHGYVGGKLLELYDYPSSIVKVVERHVLGGFTAEEAVQIGLPERSFVPETWEEKIVCVADKLGLYDWEEIDQPQKWLEKLESRFTELRQHYAVTEPYHTSMQRAKHFVNAMVRIAMLI
ncbi:MAG: HDIG domain-containing metalloprotein [Promethearchaeota archaeon]